MFVGFSRAEVNVEFLFSNTFHQVNAIATKVWKFQRYGLVIEYEGKPVLPPPLITLCHIYMTLRALIRLCRGKKPSYDNALSKLLHSLTWSSMLMKFWQHVTFDLSELFLEREDVEKVHDFEEEAMEDLSREKDHNFALSTEQRVRSTNDRCANVVFT